MGDSLVVIDCETTGLYRTDRIVEVAVVVLDSNSLEIIDEFDTLVNPERDVGPVDVHGVTASMVEAAGGMVSVTKGSIMNFKITTIDDWSLAEKIIYG